MKRLPIQRDRTAPIDPNAPTYWRSISELEGHESFKQAQEREFVDGGFEPPEHFRRRGFLALLAAGSALAGLAGCRRPEEQILPYTQIPEEIIPGVPLFYATSMPFNGNAIGLTVESHEGHPTKIEGNKNHPESLGAAHGWAQASILDLYDPDRTAVPREKGASKTWEDAQAALGALGTSLTQRQGKGFAILTEDHRSPTVRDLVARVRTAMPEAKVYRYEAFGNENIRAGARLAFGRDLDVDLDLGADERAPRASVIVLLEADLFGDESSNVRSARGWAVGRNVEGLGRKMSRMYAAESAPSVSGTKADHRHRIAARKIPALLSQIVKDLGANGVAVGVNASAGGTLSDADKAFAKTVAKDLAAAKGSSLLVAGRGQPAAVHALAFAVNAALGNVGKTIHFREAFDPTPEGPAALAELTKSIEGGQIDTLLVLGGNPAFNAPADLKFADAMKKLKMSVHVATHLDETSAAATWHINRAHYLESWGDTVSLGGKPAVVQPLIAPIWNGKTDAEVLEALLGGSRKDYDLVRETWRHLVGMDFEPGWRRALLEGIHNAYLPAVEVGLDAPKVDAEVGALAAAPEGIEVTFGPNYHAWDGRFANNGWLQGTPDPIHRITWGSVAAIAPSYAQKLGIVPDKNNPHVVRILSIKVGNAEVKLPAVICPGQAADTVSITIGLGRKQVGRVGKEVGVDTTPLRASGAFYAATATVTATSETYRLARTQDHYVMEDRPLVREGTIDQYLKDPAYAQKAVEHPPLLNLFADYKYEGHRWGMNIDLGLCTGCGSCVVACQAENNVPVIDKEGVIRSREMHWIRIDRYYEGDVEDPKSVVQPMMCQQCENAPCEQVCPVAATTHSPEGLNDMVYNRCIGTKYCGNNCPFKVRRFNYFHYTKNINDSQKLQLNPNVTVRSRGVMEKCTWCVQRINAAKIRAHKEGKDRVAPNEIMTACQQTCPTQAIVFGDLNDGSSVVAAAASSPRSFHLLDEINVRTRLSYKALIKNPNSERGT